MKQVWVVLPLAVLVCAVSANARQAQPSQAPPSIVSVVDRQVTAVEKLILDVAEAMPEEKYNFSPESLKTPGAAYKGVRTFALQLKHIAASNNILWAGLTGDKLPDDYKGGNGPEAVKTRAEIIKFVKDSYALGHRAAAALTAQNILETPEGSRSTRLHLATFAVAHAYDHYGQLVEYLRMNGIVPPASRPKSN
jgi:DinB family protein